MLDRPHLDKELAACYIETAGLPTKVAFDHLVGIQPVTLRLHVGRDRADIEGLLKFPKGNKGLALRQMMRFLNIPRPAKWELLGKVENFPEMTAVFSYWQGIPFSRVDLYSFSQRKAGVYDSADIGDRVAHVGMGFEFPQRTRSITLKNARELRLIISDRTAVFNETRFPKSTPDGLTDEGLIVGRMFTIFRRAHQVYRQDFRRVTVDGVPRRLAIVDTADAFKATTIIPLANRLASYRDWLVGG